jgi:hypothetical protein
MRTGLGSCIFIRAYCIYLLAVIAAFAFGLAEKDSAGVSFIPTVLLTLPWFFVSAISSLPRWLFSALTAFYDLPLFSVSALLNICFAELVRRFFALKREEKPPSLRLR